MRTASPSLRASTAPVVRAWRAARLLAAATCASLALAACGGGGDGGDGGTGTTPAISVSVASNALTLAPGASGTVGVTVGRSGGFTGDVALSATSTGGLTVQVTPASLGSAETAASLGVAVPAGTANGSYAVTVRATGTGVTERTATVNVTVGSSGSATNVPFAFCASRAPTWVAYQSGTGAWTRLTSTTNTYTAPIVDRGAVAFVLPSLNGGFETQIYYGTVGDLTTAGQVICATTELGTKAVTGSVAGIGNTASDDATILFGSGARVIGSQALTYSLTRVVDAPRDLLAVQKAAGTPRPVVKLITRRGLNPANGSALPVLDFAAAEAFAPASATLTIDGRVNNEQAIVTTALLTANGFVGTLPYDLTDPQASSTLTYYGLPAARQVAGDLHEITAAVAGRESHGFFTDIVNRTLTLGPALSNATIGGAGTAPYVRPRATFASQTEYGAGARAQFAQNAGSANERGILIVATSGSTALASNTWTLELPDFTAAGGYQATWAPVGGAPVSAVVYAFADRVLLPRSFVLPGGTPTANTTLKLATRTGAYTP